MAAWVLAASVAGCASPSPPGPGDAGVSGLVASSAPRFAASGPDAAEYGAGAGYPLGDRSTFFTIPFLVGSHSRLDEVFNAVLRDYARLGLLLAHDGNWRGRQIVPAAWIKDATSRHPDQDYLWPGIATPFFGYGYQIWIFPGEQRRLAFLGVRGQSILVDPQSRLVMVQTSVRKRPSNDPVAALTRALWEAVVAALGS